jgi:hypothetical protein
VISIEAVERTEWQIVQALTMAIHKTPKAAVHIPVRMLMNMRRRTIDIVLRHQMINM